MKPLVIVIDSQVQAKAKVVQLYAWNNKTNKEDLKLRVSGEVTSPGEDLKHVLEMPIGYRAVFSIDEDPELGWCQILSISIEGRKRLPNPYATEMIAKLFCMEQENCRIIPIEKEMTIRLISNWKSLEDLKNNLKIEYS